MQIPVLTTAGDASSSPEPRQGEPLTFGVPLPRGLARDTDGWTFVSPGQPARPVQARATDRWADGSVRWALLDVRADIAPGAPSSAIFIGPDAPKAEAAPTQLTISEAGGVVTVDTGVARFQLRHGGPFPFESVSRNGSAAVDPAVGGLEITESGGTVHRPTVGTVEVEERGPVRSAVRLTGVLALGGGRQSVEITARIHFFAGLPTIRLVLTLRNPDRAVHEGGFWDLGDPGSVLLKDVSLSFALPPGAGEAAVYASPERSDGQWGEVCLPFEIYQDSSGGENWQSSNHINRERRVPTTFRGYRVRSGKMTASGLRATPIASVRRGSAEITATLPDFWQNFPKALEVNDARLAVRLFPGQFGDLHELQGGEQKTHECFFSFGPDPVTTIPLAWARTRTVTVAAPEWSLGSNAIPFLAPLAPDHAALINVAIDGPDRFELKNEKVDEFGWRHFGDIYGDHEGIREPGPPLLVSHYNNQYDTTAGFAYQFFRTADPRWFHMMTALAAHVVDIDVYHTSRDKSTYSHGMFWHTYHYGDADTGTHRAYPRKGLGRIHGGGPSAGHNYTTGLMLHYFLTGEAASRETVIELADYVIAMDDGRLSVFRWLDRGRTGFASMSAPTYYGPGRGPANSLVALMDAYRLSGADRFRTKAEELLRRVVHPADVVEKHELHDPEQRWFYTMFLQSLGRYLHAKDERGEHDEVFAYGQASLLHYARWMVANEHPALEKPEKVVYPTETWPAQDMRKSDVLSFAAMHAAPEERDAFLQKARFFFRASIDTLSSMPTRVFTRPIAILLTSGQVQSWTERRPHSYPVAPRRDFGAPAAFVPQRQRVEQRLKWLAVTGLVTLGGLAVLMWSMLT